ncbi:hypothetical protein P175DRAFT_0510751 [Aspergillus ochraceoroseus IBT 24754]|uniref:Uncharacterized protein n=3 Tax=Aspergillus subgen. Nidulantes TaxID=2720870 RepID=A0A0F8V464_9EURO|nr:uncharacterized protein P175DRAFT_0510751 [Aspergillus ochraceoroseus IBT 24754]KKK14221.1 hypothetical protein AOCH_000345 [Aspergillus ochraceoroseus]KKK26568.1 hypothetical protein ARAM_002993 [Aspergillus rambellii]PTU19500.1 hypothetical protein P175DRAFT_0510751 [Aspergillus ochraceoroseus IBT 24754]
MSDADQGWKPNRRPQSTMAQAFSTALDSAFSLDSDVDYLSQTIDQKKFQMIIQNRELEELQVKIRDAEKRLKARQSLILDGSSRPADAQQEGGYQSTESASSATSPTDMAGQYSSGDEQRPQDREDREQGRHS